MWAGIVGDTIIDPFFIKGNFSAENYDQLLQQEILPPLKIIIFLTHDLNKMALRHIIMLVVPNF